MKGLDYVDIIAGKLYDLTCKLEQNFDMPRPGGYEGTIFLIKILDKLMKGGI